MDESKKVSLKKKGWTDPETGEYYPGGNPNEISKTVQSGANTQSSFASSQYSAFPEMQTIHADSDREIYPQGNPAQQNAQSTQNTQTVQNPQDDLSIHIEYNDGKKFCKFCGKRIAMDAVVCTYCGRQVEMLKTEPGEKVVVNRMTVRSKPRNKWVSFFLCIFLGYLGIHRFYEGKFGTGLLWLFTGGLFSIGWIVDAVLIGSMEKSRYYIDDKGKRKELK